MNIRYTFTWVGLALTAIGGAAMLSACDADSSASASKEVAMKQDKASGTDTDTDAIACEVTADGAEACGTGHWKGKTEEEWRKTLTPEQYRIARQAGTERAFTGKYWDTKTSGVYHCAACEQPLFSSETKFDSGTGWPSFWEPLKAEAVSEHTDEAHGMVRTEVKCAQCDAHLGHVFNDGPDPTGLRYCMNSAVLNLVPADKQETAAAEKK